MSRCPARLAWLLGLVVSFADAASLTLDRPSVPPGQPLGFDAAGFAPGEPLTLYLDDQALAPAYAADGHGALRARATPPTAARAGLHRLTLRGATARASAALRLDAPWAQFGFDAAHTRHALYETRLSAARLGELTLHWRKTFRCGGQLYTSPAVRDGLLYVGCPAAGRRAYGLSALNEASGTTHWSRTGDGFGLSSPALAGDLVISGSREDGRLSAFDARSGAPRWSLQTEGFVIASPTVADGRVFVGSKDARVYALDVASGALLWRADTGGAITASAALAGGTLFVGAHDGSLYAFAADDGHLRWRAPTGGALQSPPLAGGDAVFVESDDGLLYAFAQADGTPRWAVPVGTRAPEGDQLATSAAYADGVLYLGSRDQRVRAVDAVDGRLRWSTDLGAPVLASPALANGLVFVATVDGRLQVLDAADGQVRLDRPVGDGWPIQHSVVVANGRVYLGASDNTLYAFGLPEDAPAGAP